MLFELLRKKSVFNPNQGDNGQTLEDSIINFSKVDNFPNDEKNNQNLFSLNGWNHIMRELIGRDIIDEKFKGVRVEENLELIINAGRHIFNLNDEAIFSGIDKKSRDILNKTTKTTGLSPSSVNFVTNKTSSQLFLNIQNQARLSNEDFQKIAYKTQEVSKQTNALLYAFNYDLFQVFENFNTLANTKNSTKTNSMQIIESEDNKRYDIKIKLTPLTGIKFELPVAHWNIGILKYFCENCAGFLPENNEFKINELTREITYTSSFDKQKVEENKKSGLNLLQKGYRIMVNNKIERLQLESGKIEIEKELKTEQVDRLYEQTKTIMNQMRHRDTSDHMTKMAYLSILMGKQMGLSTEDLRCVVRSFPIHDIWKNSTPHQILHSKGKLNNEEYVIMQDHARGSEYTMLKCGYTLKEARIGSGHQLNADGSSYPALEPILNDQGIIVDVKAADFNQLSVIDMIGRFTDGLETLNAKRIYKNKMSIEFILENIFRADVEKKKILQEDIGLFGIEQFGKTLIDIGYSAERYNPDQSLPISYKEREIMKYIIGYSDKFKVQIPPKVQELVSNHTIEYGTLENRVHCVGLSLRKDYDKLETVEAKETFKRNAPYELLNAYLPDDGISII